MLNASCIIENSGLTRRENFPNVYMPWEKSGFGRRKVKNRQELRGRRQACIAELFSVPVALAVPFCTYSEGDAPLDGRTRAWSEIQFEFAGT